MENLLFDNNIKVTVTQSPINPVAGDDVTFNASVFFSRPSEDYAIPNTYFFSYTWLVSSDGGNNFYQVGYDLEELIIYNIDQTFFNNIYKVQVALIDLNNIILTEDGDNLTTQFGEIIVGSSSSSSLSIQTINNNSSTTNVSPVGTNSNIESLDTVNLESVIQEASAFDTTITPETSAEVLSGQVTLDKFGNSQIIDGAPLVITPVEELPDPIVETEMNQQSIMFTTYNARLREWIVACDTKLSYKVCKQSSSVLPIGDTSLENCLSTNNACTEDDILTIPIANFDRSDPDRPISLGNSIGSMPSYIVNKIIGSPYDFFPGSSSIIRTGCCTGNLMQVCPFEKKTGSGNCDGEYLDTYIPSIPTERCKNNYVLVRRKKSVLLDAKIAAQNPRLFRDDDCGCNRGDNPSIPLTMELKAIENTDGTLQVSYETNSFDQPIPETNTGIGSFSDNSQILVKRPDPGDVGHVQSIINSVVGLKNGMNLEQVRQKFIENSGGTTAAAVAAARAAAAHARLLVSAVSAAAPAGTTLGTITLGGAYATAGVAGFGLGYTISYITGLRYTFVFFYRDRNGTAAPIHQIECQDTIFKQIYKCIDTRYTDSDDESQYITCDIQLKSDRTGIASYEQLQSPPIFFEPSYNCNCIRSNGEQYTGSITIERWNTDELLSKGLSLSEINGFDPGCKWYVTEHIGKPDSNCECRLNNFPVSDPEIPQLDQFIPYINIDRVYNYTIAGIRPDYFNVVNQPIVDCIAPKSTKCSAKCEGFYCCGDQPSFVFEKGSVGSGTTKCNESKTFIYPTENSESDLPQITQTIDICSPLSSKELAVSLFTSTKRVKQCTDIVGEGQNNNLFLTEPDLIESIKTSLTANSLGILFKYQEVDDPNNRVILENRILASDGITELMPPLYKHSKLEADGGQIIVPNDRNYCDFCKVLYELAEGADQYPCDDASLSTAPDSPLCGWKANCNIPNSTDSTPYKKVTISRILDPSADQLSRVTNNYRMGGFYDDLGRAIADAQTLAGTRGIVISNPCPSD